MSLVLQTPRSKETANKKDQLRFLTCGSVDDGKSTLIGRILYDTNLISRDNLSQTKKESERYGTQGQELDLALLVDGLQAEREQGITIDIAYRYFETEVRKFIAIDAPGHEEYTRNMVTGASNAETAIILIDAEKGITKQTKRHSSIISLLGIKNTLLAVNKMDRVNYDQKTFLDICEDYKTFCRKLTEFHFTAIPISALKGCCVTKLDTSIPWYKGPSLLEVLENIDVSANITDAETRFPVQIVNRPDQNFRGYSGTLVSGKLSCGDMITVHPSFKKCQISKIIEPTGPVKRSQAGKSITIVLSEEIDISRGDMITKSSSKPYVVDQLAAHVIWLDHTALLPERIYDIRFATKETTAQITTLEYKIDFESLDHHAAKTLKLNEIGFCKIALADAVAFDSYDDNKVTGSFILIDRETKATVGAGVIDYGLRRASNIQWHNMKIDKRLRSKRYNQKPMMLWFTGLSGSGKSTIADKLEQKLVERGHFTYLLDGDNLRHGLNKDLGFTDKDRIENIRRVAEVGKLMVDAGLLVLACFISPFKAEREMARLLFNNDEFFEIFVDTPLKICEARDPKGLYKKARSGELKNFTGIDSEYEAPLNADIHLDAGTQSVEKLVNQVLKFLEKKI
ncbi:MAG: adenylyl-sulfate kinase [Pseudomonadota bacterium]|nr:adenylyl-sulfate kinase [Pseudomonadota bacterium]